MEIEIFKDAPNYENIYQASSLGNIKSLKYGKQKFLNPSLSGNGYLYVNLRKDGISKSIPVHILMAMTFLGHIPDGFDVVVDHINNIKTDNRLVNLQLTTVRHNSSKDRKGTSQYTGVSWSKREGKWQAHIQINGRPNNLGLFTSEIEASNAYQLQKIITTNQL